MLEVSGKFHAQLRQIDVTGGVFAGNKAPYIFDGGFYVFEPAKL